PVPGSPLRVQPARPQGRLPDRADPHRDGEGRVSGRLRDAGARRPLARDRHPRRGHQPRAELPCTVREPAAEPLVRRAARPDAQQTASGPDGGAVRTLLAVTWKDLRLIARDRAALLFLVLVPFVVVTVLAEALAGSDTGSLLLPVVNEDQGPVATVLVEALAEHAKVVEVSRAEAEYLVAGKKTAPAAIVLPEHTSKNYLATT